MEHEFHVSDSNSTSKIVNRFEFPGWPSSIDFNLPVFTTKIENAPLPSSVPICVDLATTQTQIFFRDPNSKIMRPLQVEREQFIPSVVLLQCSPLGNTVLFGQHALVAFKNGSGGALLRWPKKFRGFQS
jgi:hypothetical protein